MKTEINLNDSIVDSTGYFNSSEVTTLSNDGKETFQWFNEEITRLIQVITRPILWLHRKCFNILYYEKNFT